MRLSALAALRRDREQFICTVESHFLLIAKTHHYHLVQIIFHIMYFRHLYMYPPHPYRSNTEWEFETIRELSM
jgi:hypothetical protein